MAGEMIEVRQRGITFEVTVREARGGYIVGRREFSRNACRDEAIHAELQSAIADVVQRAESELLSYFRGEDPK